MIDGTESTPNTITPSGRRFPGPWVSNIHENWPTRGAIPHRHDLDGSIKPSTAETTQTTGTLMMKYHWESHASLLPEALDTTTHIRIPVATANPYNQYSFFMVICSHRPACGPTTMTRAHCRPPRGNVVPLYCLVDVRGAPENYRFTPEVFPSSVADRS